MNCWGETGWRWRKILVGFIPSSQCDFGLILQLKEAISATILNNGRDEVRWRWTWSEEFTVKSLYGFLQDGGVKDRSYVQLWKLKSPLKVKIFVWLVLRRGAHCRQPAETWVVWREDLCFLFEQG